MNFPRDMTLAVQAPPRRRERLGSALRAAFGRGMDDDMPAEWRRMLDRLR